MIVAFLRLVRWPNLLFIALTQLLYHFCIALPILESFSLTSNLSNGYWILLILSYILIAAGGNIINDYFDLNIDLINKPKKVVVDKKIKRRWVIVWHILFSAAAVFLGFYIDKKTPVKLLGLANFVCVVLLFIYSISLKKKLLAGNILIALLVAWSVLVAGFCETSNFVLAPDKTFNIKLTRLSFLYAGFAFIITLIREVVKDMEDIEGDRKFGCTTMPIVWGIMATRIFTAVWLIILIAVLIIIQFYVLQFGWWMSAAYCILLIIIPLCIALKKMITAKTTDDFATLSSLIKIIIFAGILSMVFFRLYD